MSLSRKADASWCTDEAMWGYLAPIERDLKAYLRALDAMSTVTESEPIAGLLPRSNH